MDLNLFKPAPYRLDLMKNGMLRKIECNFSIDFIHF